jgi:hypothetical protein
MSPPIKAEPSSPHIIVAGQTFSLPTAIVDDTVVISQGRYLRIARLYDEEVTPGNPVYNPEQFTCKLLTQELPADIFTFAQRPATATPFYDYPHEIDNYAAIPITTYDYWLNKQIGVDVRQNVRKSLKRGVTTRVTPFDDSLIAGISSIYNESPVRQGRPFWHYRKTHEQIRDEAGRYLERSAFIGAYLSEELIGFIKMTFTDSFADLGLIVCKQAYFDLRATNALIAKAVEVCIERNTPYLRYDKMSYGQKSNTSLSDFKRRNGFIEFQYPRYYIPLTIKGRLALHLGLHKSVQELLPEKLQTPLLRLRAWAYERRFHNAKSSA